MYTEHAKIIVEPVGTTVGNPNLLLLGTRVDLTGATIEQTIAAVTKAVRQCVAVEKDKLSILIHLKIAPESKED
jgi:hypothetical protein